MRDATVPDPAVVRDTAHPRDSARSSHIVRVDTTWLDGGRRDSMRRDSLARATRPDTSGVRPDSILRIPPG
jgi:hypothetical protein